MYIARKFPTQHGHALIEAPMTLVIPSNPNDALAFAMRANRQADVMLAEGRFEAAERLSHAALEARCRAMGGRA